MGNLAAFFGSLAVALPSRIFAAIGVGFISYAGYAVVVDSLVDSFIISFNGMPADTLAYISLAGFPTAFGIILGAIITRMSLTSLSSIGKIT